MVFSFFDIFSPFQSYSSFPYHTVQVLMTLQGVFVGMKTQNQEYFWKEWGKEMGTKHVYLTTSNTSDGA